LLDRNEQVRDDGLRLVGLKPVDPKDSLTAGAHFFKPGDPEDMAHDQGWMTSVAYSPELGYSIGLGFLKQGNERHGEKIRGFSPIRGQDIVLEVCSPHHIDPEGDRQRG
ncbi:MAG: sarcosine oxidase subunit alpha, partial [Boseongicola sp.]|nr:sarcosine oxidase subunit alpha [Boseongicola sp.]